MEKKSKTKMRLWPALILAALSLGFKTGEILELSDYLNAHRTSNVRKDAQNKIFVLTPKTTGKITQIKRLRRGNFALELQLRDGSHSGRQVWVFYDSRHPRLKLYSGLDDKSGSSLQVGETRLPDNAKLAMTTAEQEAVQTPEQQEIQEADSDPGLAAQLDTVQNTAAQLGAAKPPCPEDNETVIASAPVRPSLPGTYPESVSAAPKTDNYTEKKTYPTGEQRAEGYTAWVEPTGEVSQFSFMNYGGNSMVSGKPDENIFVHNRSFSFQMPGGARQELRFEVTDNPGETPGMKAGNRESYFVVFPRKVLPSIKVTNGVYEVTLATGEVVRFKADTHEIVGGVLSEGPLGSGFPSIHYGGSGVIIRSDAIHSDPRTGMRTATVSKPQAGQNCKVPVSQLWTEDADRPRFRFATDEGFDRFLRTQCGFGIQPELPSM
jgi:hypothetical protein